MPETDQLSELLLLWEEKRDAGTLLSPEELCASTPDLLPPLRRRIEELAAIDGRLALPGADPTPIPAMDGDPGCDGLRAPPALPGYEVTEVLGRGGMGVVYKARQARLNRVVALKVLRDSALAGRKELERFRNEAAALARLQHPHIVQVFEVGEHDGLPYFTLEFCPGGSLAERLHGRPIPPRDAARLVELLARATDAAHRQGVVHRDLKPANVLLVPSERPEAVPLMVGEGTVRYEPKIADFGLARMTDETRLTASGAVMGTPSYMAPEQAEGALAAIGPPADVYALGTLLYELLTGRPPFLAAHSHQILLQVLREQPLSPRQMNPEVDRDLETVCLKCLEKEAAKRYESADALANDLKRWLAGEPILARPVGHTERLWRAYKRNPTVGRLIAAVILLLLVVVVGLAVSTLVVWGALSRSEASLAQARAQGRRAERNLEQAAGPLHRILTDLQEQERPDAPQIAAARHAAARQVRAFFERLSDETSSDPGVRFERANAYESLAQLDEREGDQARAVEEQGKIISSPRKDA